VECRPRTVALLGIDGSGKSVLARTLVGRLAVAGDCVLLPIRQSHEVPDGPLHRLSRCLARLAAVADQKDDHETKLVALFLQLCMYGPIESFLAAAMSPRAIVSDRHPLIDATVYLPILGSIIRDPARTADRRGASLDGLESEEMALVKGWLAAQGRRLGRELDPATLAGELIGLLDGDRRRLFRAFEELLQVRPPHVALYLDTSVDTAMRRLRSRGPDRELHETGEYLARLASSYEGVLGELDETRVHRLTADAVSPEELADEAVSLICSET
jgi:thymidylate kinase